MYECIILKFDTTVSISARMYLSQNLVIKF